MADRKVLNKYIPKNFDHQRIVKRGRGRDKLMIVRNMLPMSLRCNTCSNYLYIGTKFNMRMEICNDQVYLGIKVFRFYLKCTYCYADITFKTDPKNHDYVVQAGGTRNYQPIKDAQQAEKLLKKMKVNQKQGDSMKYLQSKTYDSKRQMQLMQTLQDIKTLNKRQAVIDPEDLLKNIIEMQEQQQKLTQQQQQQIDRQFKQLRKKRIQQLKQQQYMKTIQQNQNQNQQNQNGQDEQKNNSQENDEKYYNKLKNNKQIVNKNNNLSNHFSQHNSSGKKFIMPVIKSKLNNYKKIIKKTTKTNNNEQHNQTNNLKQQNLL